MITWNDVFSANLGKMMAIQIACGELVVKNKNWNVDFNKGIIAFGDDEYPLQFLGSEANSSNTWLWAWENINGHNLSIVACGLADENYCYYRGPHSGGAIFVAFNGVDEKVFSFVDARKFIDITMRSIQQFSLNHKLFIESFLDWNKNKYKWQGNIIIADFGKDGELRIEFEKIKDNFRIKNISLNS